MERVLMQTLTADSGDRPRIVVLDGAWRCRRAAYSLGDDGRRRREPQCHLNPAQAIRGGQRRGGGAVTLLNKYF